jgi:eukaryotic-like serine/threonine-protein kinase
MELLEQLTAALGARNRGSSARSKSPRPSSEPAEQATGAAVDGRSDQYSLACTLYEMLIGQPPFTGPSAHAVIARHSLEVATRTIGRAPPVGGAVSAVAVLPFRDLASNPTARTSRTG